MNSQRIYLASSWRNKYQPQVVKDLRSAGHQVYDFRNPEPENNGFGWQQIDPDWRNWTVKQFKEALKHPISINGHKLDHDAIEWCNVGVLLLPAGSSAHLEAGWIGGRRKPVVVYAPEIREPELMYKSFEMIPTSSGLDTFCTEMSELLDFLDRDLSITP